MREFIEINIVAFNEQIMLPFTLDWYNKLFDKPKIVVYNNYSTDNTKEIALSRGCEVIDFETKGMNDTIQSQIKSNAANNSKAVWSLNIDCDECVLITKEDLEKTDCNIIKFKGIDIFDNVDSPYKAEFKGIYSPGYSKPCLIKTDDFTNITFAAGAHSIDKIDCKLGNTVKMSVEEFHLLHFKHWSLEYNLNRSKFLSNRQSKDNLLKKHSYHFSFPEQQHINYYNMCFNSRTEIIDERLKIIR